MRAPTIARNYAEALFAAAEHHDQAERYADLMEGVAGAVRSDDKVRMVLESPRVPKSEKQRMLSQALKGKAPEPFIRFLSAVVKRGRQNLIGDISTAFLGLLDIKFNRVHASVVVARKPDTKFQKEIATQLSKVVGKTVVPHFREDPAILGGVVVRIGDTVMDGSLRRKMLVLRRKMLGT